MPASHVTAPSAKVRRPATHDPIDGTGSPCDVSSETAVAEPKKPKKNRIRRAKQELEFLRRESKKLEDERAQLLQIQAQRHLNPSVLRPEAPQSEKRTAPDRPTLGYRLIAPRREKKLSAWQELAERQSKERRRALARNLALRTQLEAELKLGRQLMQLLGRQACAKALVPDSRRSSVLTEENVFRKLLERAEDALLEIKKVLQGWAFRDPSASFINTFVEKEGDEEVFVMQSSMTLPFCMAATAKALWKVLSNDKIDEYCYYHKVVQKSETVVAQVFGIHFVDDAVDVDFRGRYLFSRFKDEGRIVIVWVAEYDPINLNGVACSGIQWSTTGWIQLSGQPSAKVEGTFVRSYSRLNMGSPRNDLTEMPPVPSLRSLAQRIHDKFMASCSSPLEKALIEEDWKLNTGWIEDQGDRPSFQPHLIQLRTWVHGIKVEESV